MKNIVIFILILLVLFVVAKYVTDKDYLDGKRWHYVGESELTYKQSIELVGEFAFTYGKISEFKLIDDDLVKVKYDFFSSDEIDYLDKAEFSAWDTPLFNSLSKNIDISQLVVLVLGSSLFYFLYKDTKRNRAIKSNIMWFIAHPLSLVRKNKPPQTLFPPNITNEAKIDVVKAGIIGVRAFKFLPKDGYLYSAGIGQSCWKTKTLLSNKIPTDKNGNGCYAFRTVIINDLVYVKQVMGIVSLRGEYREHADGVIRAEQCEILHLIVDNYYEKYATKLSQYYGVPVTVTDNTLKTYNDWISSENGIECLRHNSKMLKETEYGN